jgi:hypothetical protein
MLNRTLLFLLVLAFALSLGAAQTQAQINPSDPFGTNKSDEERSMLGSPEKEMRARLAIRYAEKLRRENLERAREVAQLGIELRDAYASHKSLDRTEIKKLERLEKLTRKIRSEAGGSDDDESLKDMPGEMASALTRIAELSVELRKGVEKTPRLVISTTVIEHANQLLEIINFVRSQTR